MTQQIVIEPKQYRDLVERLIVQTARQLPDVDLVVGIIRGGFYPADTLSRALRLPWAFLYVQSYDDDEHSTGQIRFGRELSGQKPERGQTVLLVDDLVDSGRTLIKTMEWFDAHYHGFELNFKTAVIWKKACATFMPDLFVEEIPFIEGTSACPWIIQAHEQEAARIAESLGR